STGVKRAGLHGTQQRRERRGGNPLAPEFSSDPVRDFEIARPGGHKGGDTAGHSPAKQNGPFRDGIVAKYLSPFGCERRSVRRVLGGKRGLLVRGRIQLLLKEDGVVLFGHTPQEHVICNEPSPATPGVRFAPSFRQFPPAAEPPDPRPGGWVTFP